MAGGIFEIERRLAQSLADLPDMSMEVYGAEDKCTCADLPQWFPLEPKFYPFIGPQNFRYSSQLRREFVKCDADVAHLHALWMHTSLILLAWARRHRRPYIITANGMLDPWALKNSRIKKQIVGAIYERRCLDGATCIQVNSERELESVRNFGLRNPVCIIPNGVDVRPPPLGDTDGEGRQQFSCQPRSDFRQGDTRMFAPRPVLGGSRQRQAERRQPRSHRRRSNRIWRLANDCSTT